MSSINIHNQSGESIREIELPADILETPVNGGVLHQVVVMQLANRRSGTASTKNRSEVQGSGKKLYRQKGTGMARAGSRRSPIRVGGGVAFGPKPRDFGFKVPKKVKRMAIKSALVDKFQNDNVLVIDTINLERPKTKELIGIMGKLGISMSEKTLIVLGSPDENVLYSARNIPRVNVCAWDTLNTYDILWHDRLLVTQEALEKIEDKFWAIKSEELVAESQ
jgi:large subunit ribosomal protein L4